MKVLITGGTGFVGSHVARLAMAQGCTVRLLVRDLVRAESLYASFGGAIPEFMEGDITQRATLDAAVAGCDAVVHAAAATPMQAKTAAELLAVNVEGVKHVVDAALAQGITQIVCISSITAIFSEQADKVTADAAPVPSSMPYGQSKVAAELYLRQRQGEGAPIAILYPGGVIGPDDPGFSDTCRALQHRIQNGFRIFGDGGMQHIDVRDLAQFACAILDDGKSGRYLVPGVYLRWTELADVVESASGCELHRIPAQGWKLRLVGRLIDVVRRFRTVDSPISAETMRYATLWPNIPNTDELALRGIRLRDPRETFTDTLQWMVATGHLDVGQCPKLAQNT